MRIIVDENIPSAIEVFGQLADLIVLPGRTITAKEVKTADALIIRSVTKVNEKLLADSPVKFVGTATIGFDHIDIDYLRSREIQFTSAAGSNANAVAEYVVAALFETAGAAGKDLERSSIAIVGVGHVGSQVLKKAEALGMRIFLNDPPKFRETGDPRFLPLVDALREADFVTLHVPLEKKGPDATYHLANWNFFSAMKPGAVFLNTSRGDVVEEEALMRAQAAGKIARAVLDVWHGEPLIDPDLVEKTFLATAHIAGYSAEGKITATAMIYDAFCQWLNRRVLVAWNDMLPAPQVSQIDLTGLQGDDETLLRPAIRQVYDIRMDDQALRRSMNSGEKRGVEFDLLRDKYPLRREFTATRVIVPNERPSLNRKASGLGFRVDEFPLRSNK